MGKYTERQGGIQKHILPKNAVMLPLEMTREALAKVLESRFRFVSADVEVHPVIERKKAHTHPEERLVRTVHIEAMITYVSPPATSAAHYRNQRIRSVCELCHLREDGGWWPKRVTVTVEQMPAYTFRYHNRLDHATGMYLSTIESIH